MYNCPVVMMPLDIDEATGLSSHVPHIVASPMRAAIGCSGHLYVRHMIAAGKVNQDWQGPPEHQRWNGTVELTGK